MRVTNYFSHALMLVALAGLCSSAQAQSARTYRGSFVGSSSRSQNSSQTTLVGQVSDSLSGYLMITLNYGSNNSINGGHWTLIVTSRKADGSASEEGRLEGTLSGGSVALNQDSTVVSVNSVQLTIKSGRGIYGSVAGGQGTFEAGSVPAKRAPFDGALTLTF